MNKDQTQRANEILIQIAKDEYNGGPEKLIEKTKELLQRLEQDKKIIKEKYNELKGLEKKFTETEGALKFAVQTIIEFEEDMGD